MKEGYWHQEAAPWVSFAVLAGGLVSAALLFWLVRMENSLQSLSPDYGEEQIY